MAVLGCPFTALLAVTDWLLSGDWDSSANWSTATAAWVLWPLVPNAVFWAFAVGVARERGPFRKICRAALFVAGAQLFLVVLSWAAIGYGWSDGPYDDWVLSCAAPGTWIAIAMRAPSLLGGPSAMAAGVILGASSVLNWMFWVVVGSAIRRVRRRLTSRPTMMIGCVSILLVILSGAWPNALGQIVAGSRLIRLRAESGEAFAKGGYEEYCVGGCELFVPAKGTIQGRVNYGAFGDPLWVASLPNRSRHLDVRPARCRHRRG